MKRNKQFAVYRIFCSSNKKSYIGIDSYFPSRWYQHLYYLRRNSHLNKHLQSAYNKYGESSFSLYKLESCDTHALMKDREIHWIAVFNTYLDGFNQTRGGEGRLGYSTSEETKRKISAAHKGKKLSQQHKDSIRLASVGNRNSVGIKRSDVYKENVRIFMKQRSLLGHPFQGKHHTQDTKERLSNRFSGEKSPRSKLKNEDAIYIRSYLSTNLSKHKTLRQAMIYLANRYNVALNTIKGVYYKKTFTNI